VPLHQEALLKLLRHPSRPPQQVVKVAMSLSIFSRLPLRLELAVEGEPPVAQT
jgi:hypothetical protein